MAAITYKCPNCDGGLVLMEFTGSGRDVADPWYTGDFDTTWSDVTEGCAALLDYILERI